MNGNGLHHQVLFLAASGHSAEVIAREMGVSVLAVRAILASPLARAEVSRLAVIMKLGI